MKDLEKIAGQSSSLFEGLEFLKDFEAEWNKVIFFCNYRERCISEVTAKMRDLALSANTQEDFLGELTKLDLVNNERFAILFTTSKFNQKHWGRNKIRKELLAKKIEGKYISKALFSLDDERYLEKLDFLLERKKNRTKAKSKQDLQMKLYNFVYFKGYEPELIRSRMAKLV